MTSEPRDKPKKRVESIYAAQGANKSDAESGMTFVFVYGSLKRGHQLHKEIQHQSFVGQATSEPQYRLYDCGDYPGLIKAPRDGKRIHGELYHINSDCLRRLDIVECVSEGLYIRELIDIATCSNFRFQDEPVWAWFYLHETAGLRDCGSEWP